MKAIDILEPTVLLLPYKARDKFDEAYHFRWNTVDNYELLDLDGRQTRVLTFYHPSAPPYFWGQSLQSEYLHNTIIPTIERMHCASRAQ